MQKYAQLISGNVPNTIQWRRDKRLFQQNGAGTLENPLAKKKRKKFQTTPHKNLTQKGSRTLI